MKNFCFNIILLFPCVFIGRIYAQEAQLSPFSSFHWIQHEIEQLKPYEISIGIPPKGGRDLRAVVFTNLSKFEFSPREIGKLDSLDNLEFIALHRASQNESSSSNLEETQYVANVLAILRYFKIKNQIKHLYLENITNDIIVSINNLSGLSSLGIKDIRESDSTLKVGSSIKTLYINGARVFDAQLPNLSFPKKSHLERFTYAGNFNMAYLEIDSCKYLKEIHLFQSKGDLILTEKISKLPNIIIAELCSFDGNLVIPQDEQLFPQLDWLKIQCRNQIVPTFVYDLKSLSYLRFNECHFHSIGNKIKNLKNLKELAITEHQGELKKLNVSKLESLDKLFIHLANKPIYKTKLMGLTSHDNFNSLTLLEMPLEHYLPKLKKTKINLLNLSACQAKQYNELLLTLENTASIRIISSDLFRESEQCFSETEQIRLQKLMPKIKVTAKNNYVYLEGIEY